MPVPIGAKDVGIGAGVDHSKNIFAAPDAEGAGASFRDDICAGVAQGEQLEKIGACLFGVILPADEFQLHSIPDGGRQGGGKDRWSFAADDADGVRPASRAAKAVAMRWLDQAPPKVMIGLAGDCCACWRYPFNLNHLLPEMTG